MIMLLKLAWRNVLRNKRRTVLSGLAVGVGLAAMIFVDGLYKGMLESMIRTATDTFLGQGQIHA
jgi:ABC-type lipoprotein release transport system permease subunit